MKSITVVYVAITVAAGVGSLTHLATGDEIVLQLDEQAARYVDPAGKSLAVASQKNPLGLPWAAAPHNPAMRLNNASTVEAWVLVRRATSEGLQALVSKWAPVGSFGDFAAYDAGVSSGLDSTGFLGASAGRPSR